MYCTHHGTHSSHTSKNVIYGCIKLPEPYRHGVVRTILFANADGDGNVASHTLYGFGIASTGTDGWATVRGPEELTPELIIAALESSGSYRRAREIEKG